MKVKVYDTVTKQTTYRDMTADEIAEFEKQQSEMPEPEPTQEERIKELEEQLKAITKLFEED